MRASAWLGRAGAAAVLVWAALAAVPGLSQPAPGGGGPGPASAGPAAPEGGGPDMAAPPGPVVLELYTSQGCVACPPADEVFAGFADAPGVIALALHVDYWDYLGWKDSFGAPAFTQRQKRYAKAAGARMIYTPQAIVAGIDRLEGQRPEAIADSIAARAALPPRVALTIRREGDRLVIEALADPPLDRLAVVQVVRYHPEETVTIERGENAGHTVSYRNIVTDWSPVAEWGGKAPLRLEAAVQGADPLVVIVQETGPGPILAAARLER